VPRSESDVDHEPQIGPGSLWLLRIAAAVFLLVLGWFLVDAIVG
jgi:p-aminobenzoyl-glutamate transporter AbgT